MHQPFVAFKGRLSANSSQRHFGKAAGCRVLEPAWQCGSRTHPGAPASNQASFRIVRDYCDWLRFRAFDNLIDTALVPSNALQELVDSTSRALALLVEMYEGVKVISEPMPSQTEDVPSSVLCPLRALLLSELYCCPAKLDMQLFLPKYGIWITTGLLWQQRLQLGSKVFISCCELSLCGSKTLHVVCYGRASHAGRHTA